MVALEPSSTSSSSTRASGKHGIGIKDKKALEKEGAMYKRGSLPITSTPHIPPSKAPAKKGSGETRDFDADDGGGDDDDKGGVPETSAQAMVHIIEVVATFNGVQSKLRRNDASKPAPASKGGSGSGKRKGDGAGQTAPAKKKPSTPTDDTITDVEIPPLAPLSHPQCREWAEALRIASAPNLVASLRYQVDQFQVVLPGATLEEKAQYAQNLYETNRPISKVFFISSVASCLVP